MGYLVIGADLLRGVTVGWDEVDVRVVIVARSNPGPETTGIAGREDSGAVGSDSKQPLDTSVSSDRKGEQEDHEDRHEDAQLPSGACLRHLCDDGRFAVESMAVAQRGMKLSFARTAVWVERD